MRFGARNQHRAQRTLPGFVPVLFAELHELQPVRERRFRAGEERVLAERAGHRDAIDRRQQQRPQHERVRRQERRHVEPAGRLPRERLVVVAVRLAAPLEHAKEMKLDVRVRVDVALDEPRRSAHHGEAELFMQLAVERGTRRFAGFQLAAGKFPVARVRLAERTLGQQHVAVRPQDDCRRDADNRSGHFDFGRLDSAAAPA
jgi:hypothetical protein